MRGKILFVYTAFSSFVKTDYEILLEDHDLVKHQYIQGKSVFQHFGNQIKIFFFLVKNILSADSVFVWFADYHSFLPVLFAKIFGRKAFLVLGGYDVTYIPKYNYGSFNNPVRAVCAKYSIKNATLNLCVSDNIKTDALRLVSDANATVLYTGYSPDKFYFTPEEKRDGIISVCGANTLQRIYIKGVDLLLETAELLPEENFYIVAVNEDILEKNFNVPSNVKVINEMPQAELIDLFRQTSVYAQLSIREGLPNSVCEAMLCGCVPVGVDAGGIPIAIGDAGFISSKRDAAEISGLIERALKADNVLRTKARQRIIDNFTLAKRVTKLKKIINDYLGADADHQKKSF